PTTVNVATNDTDVDGDLAPTSVSLVSSPAAGTTTNNGDGTITYSPAANASGTFTITYQICDTTAPTPLCDQADLTVTVLAADDPPVVVDDTLTVNEDTPGTVDVASNDSDPDGNLDLTTVTITSPATNGSTAINPVTGVVTYTPDPNYTGADSFTYQICDSTGLCGTADVAVTVDAQADGPVTVDDNTTMAEDGSVTVDVAFNDSDPDGNLDPASVSITSGPSNGTATPNGDGTITYDPDPNWFGIESITYQICDTTAPTPLCATGTLTVTVNGVPDLPVAQDDTVSTAEDTSVVIDVVGNDTDVDGNLDPTSVTISTPPTAGSVSVDAVTGAVTYSPPSEWSGIDSFEYQICDTGGNCDNAVATVTVFAVNDAPVAQDDSATVPEDGSVTVDVMANDTDIDSSLDAASVTVEIPPAHGTTTVDPATGAITYTPDPDFHGTDSFTYQVCHPGQACDTATVSLTVTPVNDPPVRVNEVAFELLLGETPGPLEFTDPEADVYSATVVSGGLPPGLELQPDGTFVGQAQVVGVFTATIEVCDVLGACSTSVLVLQVAGATLSVLPFTGPTLAGLVIGGLMLMLSGTGLHRLARRGGAHRRRHPPRRKHRARR
ncbi:MAG: tandem-95 repeat protein, partial [Acidimicrobiia bacterium]|nr:tandem-95 repeat protein [Acidimicrobiia bacterium]